MTVALPPVDPARLVPLALPLARCLSDSGLDAKTLGTQTLDAASLAALHRGEPGGIDTNDVDATARTLLELFYLHLPVAETAARTALGDLWADLHAAGGIYVEDDEVRATFDIRPQLFSHADGTEVTGWILSDPDGSVSEYEAGPNHVPGVGAASLSLHQLVPPQAVASLADIGCGSGVHLVAQAAQAGRLLGTDVSERALDFARASLAASGVEHAELTTGSWFEPLGEELFERIVANPPFVVGPPTVGHVYRDSGLGLDGATRLVVSEAPSHLEVGGQAFLLGAWVHGDPEEGSWQSRIASWLPDRGVSAWVAQRDVVDPAQYVGTWLTDENIDVRSPEGIARTRTWLEYFKEHAVHAIGFGFIALENIGDKPTELMAEELTHTLHGPLGPEVAEYFRRAEWLREATPDSILDSCFAVRPGLALEEVKVAAEMGFEDVATRLTRTDGPGYSHDVDKHLAAILAGLLPQGLALRDVAELYAAANGLAPEPLCEAVVSPIVDLLRHGMIIPAEFVEDGA